MYQKVVGILITRLLLPAVNINIFQHCNNVVLCHWIDPDTKEEHYSIKPHTQSDKREYKIVFSDEFSVENRTFNDGHDPKWTSLDKNDYTNDALHYYKSENVRTSNGVLNISTTLKTNKYIALNEKTKTKYIDQKNIQSAMVQGWNKFCFTGGIIEISAKLPGKPKIGGLWPALWLLGNLARGTYVGSSDHVWPWSYNTCDENTRVSQEINACDRVTHYGMTEFEGRGSPEIDILEAMGGEPGPLPNTHIQRPYFSSSLQVAPGIRDYRPHLGSLPREGFWYDNLEYGDINGTNSDLNPFFYGVTLVHKPKSYTYQSDALSANMMINSSHFEKQHIYRVEWEPPSSNNDTSDGYIRWFADDQLVYGITSQTLTKSGTVIPNEPMYVLLNTAVSTSWGFPLPCPDDCNCDCYECGDPECTCGFPEGFCDLNIPSSFEIDYVRVYQAINESKHELGCGTKNKPTELFIKGHKERYKEKGDKEPLQNVMNGTGPCNTNDDCGGNKHGSCSMKNKLCICTEYYTGPYCLAHNAYNDNPYHQQQTTKPINFTKIMFPHSCFILLIVFTIAFFIVVIINSSQKRLERSRLLLKENDYYNSPSSNNDHNYMKEYYETQQQQEQKNQQILLEQSLDFENYPNNISQKGVNYSHTSSNNDDQNDNNNSSSSYVTDLHIPPLYLQQRQRHEEQYQYEYGNSAPSSAGYLHRYEYNSEGAPLLQHQDYGSVSDRLGDANGSINSTSNGSRGKVISYCVIDERLIND